MHPNSPCARACACAHIPPWASRAGVGVRLAARASARGAAVHVAAICLARVRPAAVGTALGPTQTCA
eukprot:6976974-Prymnesium_polylepis.1